MKVKNMKYIFLFVCFSCYVVFNSMDCIAHQAPEYWSGLPFPSPGDLPDSGIKPPSPASPVVAGGFLTTEPPGKPS